MTKGGYWNLAPTWSSSISITALLVVACSNSPASRDCDLPAHFTLQSGQAVLYETWDRVPHEWGSAEDVTLDWQDGVFLVNGFTHLPHDPPPPWKVEVLRRLYGEVPFVQDYVAKAKGDSVTRWNAASKALEELHRGIYAEARRIYRTTLDSLGSPEKAVHATASWIQQSEHVDSTALSFHGQPLASRGRIMIFLKGYDTYGQMIDLAERESIRGGTSRTYRDPSSRAEVCMIVRLMRAGFARPGNYRVEFVRGNINMFGSAGIQYSQGGKRSIDPRYHDNPYIEVKTAK